MSSIKISQLPAKGANLASTDLVEISEFTGTGYISKSITGQEIIDGIPTPSVEWGNITGALPSQTDLQDALDLKQNLLTSGTNIKTINSTSVLGSGDISVQPTLVSGTNIKSLNGASLLGSGGLSVQPTLVSGTNIKTINGNTLLGSGDLTINGGVTSVTGTSPIVSSGGATPAISINTANTSTTGALTSTDWNTFNNKQDTLVSGTNIKTINSTSLVGSGNVAVQPTLVSGTNIKYVNGFSLLGSGDLLTPVGTHGFIKPQSGQYMASGMFGTTTSYGANTGVAGRLMVYPFIPAQDISIQALAIYVNTGVAGALARIVMYTSSTTNGGNYPSIKSFESTDLDCSTTGLKTAGNIITLSKGTIYWLGVHVSSTAGILNILQSSCIALGFNSVTQTYSSLQVSNTYGSLPSGFPAGAAYQTAAPYHVFLQMV